MIDILSAESSNKIMHKIFFFAVSKHLIQHAVTEKTQKKKIYAKKHFKNDGCYCHQHFHLACLAIKLKHSNTYSTYFVTFTCIRRGFRNTVVLNFANCSGETPLRHKQKKEKTLPSR